MASAGQERNRIDAGRFPTSPGAVEALVAKTLQGQAKLEEFYLQQRRRAKQPPPTPPRNVPRPSAVNPPAGPKKAPPCRPCDGKEPLFGPPAAQAPEASSAANPPEAQVLQHLQHEKLQKLQHKLQKHLPSTSSSEAPAAPAQHASPPSPETDARFGDETAKPVSGHPKVEPYPSAALRQFWQENPHLLRANGSNWLAIRKRLVDTKRQVDTAKKFEGAPLLATTSAAGICKCRRER